jgi:hypothetical protein
MRPIVRVVGWSYAWKACALSLATLGVLTITLFITMGWSEQPPSPGLSREPIFADYAVLVSTDGDAQGAMTPYRAQTTFWRLLPDAWKDAAEWRISFAGNSIQPQAVYVEGVEVKQNLSHTSADPAFYTVPSGLIETTTRLEIVGSGVTDPNLYLHWTRSYIQSASVGSPITEPWWLRHIVAASIIAATYLLGFGFALAWCLREIQVGLREPKYIAVLSLAFAALIVASIFTTNYDLQLFKGFAEGYWVNGPLPALTISGYGPLVDILFTVPTLLYVLIGDLVGAHSELALNLAIRLPFLLGWLLLIACVSRLTRSLQLKDPRGLIRSRRLTTNHFPWLLIILNPLILFITLWQPESLLVSLVLLAFALLFEGRPIAAGIVLGIAFSGKYWPAIVGPIMLIAAWRLLGLNRAIRFVLASCSTALGLLAVYWLPTAILLDAPTDFAGLLISRMPYFGGSTAASAASVWSLYGVPTRLFQGGLGTFVTDLEQKASVLFLIIYLGIIVVCLSTTMNRRRALLASAATLALLAGMNSFTVPQFELWSLPLIVVVGASAIRPPAFMWLAIYASWCGVVVFFLSEPASYLLLHVSAAQDAFAYSIAPWFLNHLVSVPLTRSVGFVFALLLVSAAACMVVQLSLGERRLAVDT